MTETLGIVKIVNTKNVLLEDMELIRLKTKEIAKPDMTGFPQPIKVDMTNCENFAAMRFLEISYRASGYQIIKAKVTKQLYNILLSSVHLQYGNKLTFDGYEVWYEEEELCQNCQRLVKEILLSTIEQDIGCAVFRDRLNLADQVKINIRKEMGLNNDT